MYIPGHPRYILRLVTKRLVDIDDDALALAQVELGTRTMKATINEALRKATGARSAAVGEALDVLARIPLADRDEAWR